MRFKRLSADTWPTNTIQNAHSMWRSGSSGTTVQKRPTIGVRGGSCRGDQSGIGNPTGWPR